MGYRDQSRQPQEPMFHGQNSPKILIGPSHINSVGGKFQSILENAGYELVCQDVGRQLLEHELIKWLEGCSASLAGSEPYTKGT